MTSKCKWKERRREGVKTMQKILWKEKLRDAGIAVGK